MRRWIRFTKTSQLRLFFKMRKMVIKLILKLNSNQKLKLRKINS